MTLGDGRPHTDAASASQRKQGSLAVRRGYSSEGPRYEFTKYSRRSRHYCCIGHTDIEAVRERSVDSRVTECDISLTINGSRHAIRIDVRMTLLDCIREHLDLTGTKKGCDHGQCGACTVLLDGKRVNSCLVLAVSRSGSHVTTVEGLGSIGRLHPMQDAFVRHDALQCGYCTPGQICSAVGMISEGHARSREEIREAMSGNICRCGAYVGIVDAIEDVLSQLPMDFPP